MAEIELSSETWQVLHWCECDVFKPNATLVFGIYYCNTCKGVVECEFSEDDDKCFVETIHIDYFVCRKHLSDAVSNVSSRSGM